jgi:hypothetical protein
MSPVGEWRTEITYPPQADAWCNAMTGADAGGLLVLTVSTDSGGDARLESVVVQGSTRYDEVSGVTIQCDPDACDLVAQFSRAFHSSDYTDTIFYTYTAKARDRDRAVGASGQTSVQTVEDATGNVAYDCVGSWTGTGNLRLI